MLVLLTVYEMVKNKFVLNLFLRSLDLSHLTDLTEYHTGDARRYGGGGGGEPGGII